MPDLIIHDELISSHGALSVYHASIDELNRRYGGSEEDKLLRVEELLPPSGAFVVARPRRSPHRRRRASIHQRPGASPREIKRLWVRPDQRRHGVGVLLMAAVEERARESATSSSTSNRGTPSPRRSSSIERTAGTRSASIHPARTRTTSRRASANSSRRIDRPATRSTTLRATRARGRQ